MEKSYFYSEIPLSHNIIAINTFLLYTIPRLFFSFFNDLKYSLKGSKTKEKQEDKMVIGGLAVTLATGPRACGKSKLLRILQTIAGCDSVIFGDTSEIIDLHIERGTPIGRRLAEYRKDRASGKIIRNDTLILDAIKQWIDWMNRNRTVKHVLLGGSPRSEEQSLFWKRYPGETRVLHITVKNFDMLLKCVSIRQAEDGKSRSDEELEALRASWRDYNEMVVPGLKVFNGHALDLDRSESLLNRVERAIEHISLPDHVRKKWLRRLHTRSHPARVEISRLEPQNN